MILIFTDLSSYNLEHFSLKLLKSLCRQLKIKKLHTLRYYKEEYTPKMMKKNCFGLIKVSIFLSNTSCAVFPYSKSYWNMVVTKNLYLWVHINAKRVVIVEICTAREQRCDRCVGRKLFQMHALSWCNLSIFYFIWEEINLLIRFEVWFYYCKCTFNLLDLEVHVQVECRVDNRGNSECI